jgi:hypothetical protein
MHPETFCVLPMHPSRNVCVILLHDAAFCRLCIHFPAVAACFGTASAVGGCSCVHDPSTCGAEVADPAKALPDALRASRCEAALRAASQRLAPCIKLGRVPKPFFCVIQALVPRKTLFA